MHIHGLSQHTAYSTASDVLCHSPSISAGSAQGRRSTSSVPTRSEPELYSDIEAICEPHKHLGSLRSEEFVSVGIFSTVSFPLRTAS